MADAIPPAHASAWVFDVEADYRAARNFDPGTAERRAEALLGEGDAAEQFLAAASARGDLAAALGAGAVLQRQGRLTGENRHFYASALLFEGRAAEAVELLQTIIDEAPELPVNQAALAEACAAAGLFERGRVAADRSQAIRPKLEVANLARRLKWIGRIWSHRDTVPWSEAAKMIEGCLLIDAPAPASRLLRDYDERPPQGELSASEAQSLASKALRLKLPEVAAPFVRRLAGDDPTVQALRIELQGRLGDVKGAAEAADAIMQRAAGSPPRDLAHTAAAAYAAAGRPGDAIRVLDTLVLIDDRDFETLIALQRCVGQYVLSGLDLPWAAPRPPKVVNLMPFYKERMLLDLRLDEMGGWVDHFVVSEAAETFTGRAKPLHFAQMKGLFAKQGDQVLGVAVEQFPDVLRSAWAREFYQRDMAVSALAGIWRPDDIVLITDADEIVDRRAFADGWPDLANLRMATSQLFFNYVADLGTRHGDRRSGAVCRAAVLARFGSSYVRSGLSATRKRWESLPRAGWHFTSLTDAEGLAAKFTDFSHQDDSKAALRDVGSAGELLAAIRAGRYEPGWSRRPIDERLPRYVRENQTALASVILRD